MAVTQNIDANSSRAVEAAFRARDNGSKMVGYHDGQAAAYAEAARMMRAELARLRNKFQNGALTADDFAA